MKKHFLILFLLLAGLMTMNAQQFEGQVIYKYESGDAPTPVFKIKDNRVRMEMDDQGENIIMISDGKSGDIYILTEQNGQKIAIKQSSEQLDQMASMAGGDMTSDDGGKNVEIKMTNDTKTISGYRCTKVIATYDDNESIGWVTKDINLNFYDLFPSLKKMNQSNDPMQAKLMEAGFVMEMETTDPRTGEPMKLQAMVEEQKLSEDYFKVPDDYQVLDMTNMMQLMQEAQKDPEKMQQLQQMMQNMQR